MVWGQCSRSRAWESQVPVCPQPKFMMLAEAAELWQGPLAQIRGCGGWGSWTGPWPTSGAWEHFSVHPLSSHHPLPRRRSRLGEVAAWGSWGKATGTKPAHKDLPHPLSMVTTVLSNTHSNMLPTSLSPPAKPEPMGVMGPLPAHPLLSLPVTKNSREHSGNPKDTRGTAPRWGPPQPWHPTQGLPSDEAPTTYSALATARPSGKRLTNSPADPGKGPGPVNRCPPPALMLLWPLRIGDPASFRQHRRWRRAEALSTGQDSKT